MFRDFLFKKMIEKKVEGLNDEQKSEIVEILKNNPDFFKQIAEEIQEEVKNGLSEQEAAVKVAKRNQNQIMDVFKKGGFVK